MALQDTITKQYMSKADIFADAFNYLIYSGEKVIQPEQLSEMDTTQIAIPYLSGEKGKPSATQKYRDVLKTLVVKTDNNCTYLVLGIENQSSVHYAMPVRNMLYDVLQYEKQVRELAAKHKRERDVQNAEEYLSGLTKEDKIIPVITLVVNFGDKKWDAPLTLRDMMTHQSKEVLALLPDYRVLMIDPMAMEEKDFEKLHSSLKEVLLCIRAQKNKDEMKKLLQTNPNFSHLDREAAMVIRTMTHTKFEIDEQAEVINMCEAIQSMIDDGIMQGRIEGRMEGRMEGRTEGREEGMRREKREIALRLLKMGLPMKQVMEATALSENEITELNERELSG